MSNSHLLLSDARGVYIPRDFVEGFAIAGIDGQEAAPNVWQGIRPEDAETCKNPDAEWYWDAWNSILDSAYMIDKNGIRWSLHQDGDLWAVAWDEMTEEEKENFGPY